MNWCGQDSVGERVARELAEDDDLLTHLFNYLVYDQTYISASTLIEDILQNRPVLLLSHIREL